MDAGNVWKAFVAAVGTAATYLWGGWDAALTALVLVITLDYLTGVAAAWRQKRLNSEIGAHGLLGKIGILVLVALAHVLDGLLGASEPLLRTATIYWYVANEAFSITENLGLMGVPIPPQIVEALERLRERGEEG